MLGRALRSPSESAEFLALLLKGMASPVHEQTAEVFS
jgi:hypothetical protein